MANTINSLSPFIEAIHTLVYYNPKTVFGLKFTPGLIINVPVPPELTSGGVFAVSSDAGAVWVNVSANAAIAANASLPANTGLNINAANNNTEFNPGGVRNAPPNGLISILSQVAANASISFWTPTV